jgi:hypothetical protein
VTIQHLADRLEWSSMKDVELVMIGGRVQFAQEALLEGRPFKAKRKLKPCLIEGFMRWLRTPVNTPVQKPQEVRGRGEIRPGCRNTHFPADAEAQDGR